MAPVVGASSPVRHTPGLGVPPRPQQPPKWGWQMLSKVPFCLPRRFCTRCQRTRRLCPLSLGKVLARAAPRPPVLLPAHASPPPHTHAASPSRPELPETERLPSPGPETPQGWQQLQLFPQSLPQRWTRPPQFCTISQWGDAPPFGQPLESIRRNRREGGREELAPSRPCRCQGSRGVARRVLVWSRSPTAPQGPGGLERGHSVPELPP